MRCVGCPRTSTRMACHEEAFGERRYCETRSNMAGDVKREVEHIIGVGTGIYRPKLGEYVGG